MLSGLADRLLYRKSVRFFLPLIYPRTRSTLRHSGFQHGRWGNYTIFIMRAANPGLSARVSDNRSLHVVVIVIIAKEKGA